MMRRMLTSEWFIRMLALFGIIHSIATRGLAKTFVGLVVFIVITFIGVWVINLVQDKEQDSDR